MAKLLSSNPYCLTHPKVRFWDIQRVPCLGEEQLRSCQISDRKRDLLGYGSDQRMVAEK
ncbi:hypothetical protein [Scytonema millei]|uniref:Uncharacterized protein n=1 Tax=Scytonema millei VB511283 TaxID=1245923 RepID=A0A9X5EDM1_9CYAN|nr:hypothetical protein [Scytonema millei]NHC37917.1 hypothetical protein [Scytonema millei VB511283]